jgi:hypothetical protein
MVTFKNQMETDLDEGFFTTSDFSVASTWTPAGQSSKTVNGIFDRNFVDVELQETIIQEYQITFQCQSSDLTSPAQITEGDTMAIDGTTYVVVNEETDGTGSSLIKLKASS